MGNEKMSKSLGNFITLQTLCPTKLDQRAYRYLIVSSQYRNPLSFTEQIMQASKKSLQRIDKIKLQLDQLLLQHTSTTTTTTTIEGLLDPKSESDSALIQTVIPKEIQNFEAAILDDLSMPRAAAALFNLVKAAEQEMKKDETQRDISGLLGIRTAMLQMDQVFGILEETHTDTTTNTSESSSMSTDDARNNSKNANMPIPDEVLQLVQERINAKEAQDYTLADTIRQQIKNEYGYVIKDVKGGAPIITPVES